MSISNEVINEIKKIYSGNLSDLESLQLISDYIRSKREEFLIEEALNKDATLRELFDKQIETLKKQGHEEQILSWLENSKEAVVERAMGIEFKKDHIPFLPVINRMRIPIDKQAQGIECLDFYSLDSQRIWTEYSDKSKCYWTFGVWLEEVKKEDGQKPSNLSLRVEEIIAFILHGGTFPYLKFTDFYTVCALATRVGRTEYVGAFSPGTDVIKLCSIDPFSDIVNEYVSKDGRSLAFAYCQDRMLVR